MSIISCFFQGFHCSNQHRISCIWLYIAKFINSQSSIQSARIDNLHPVCQMMQHRYMTLHQTPFWLYNSNTPCHSCNKVQAPRTKTLSRMVFHRTHSLHDSSSRDRLTNIQDNTEPIPMMFQQHNTCLQNESGMGPAYHRG